MALDTSVQTNLEITNISLAYFISRLIGAAMSIWTTYLVLAVLHICIVDVVALECYACVDSASLTSCNTSTTCIDDQVCFFQSKPSPSGITFDMGCHRKQDCRSHGGVDVIGRSATARRQTGTCLECCSTQLCNADLCHHETHGGWSDWGTWETCTVTCGGGIRRRYRKCDNPRPSTSGHACIGSAEETNTCNIVQCPSDCYDIKQNDNAATSGVYTIRPRGIPESVLVYCDMDRDGGGWTVFQRRINGDVDFYRNFQEYKMGFGNISGEFWLGLRYIQQLTAVAPSELRLDLMAADNSTAYEVFKNFSLSAGPAYKLHIDPGTGTAGDSYSGFSYHNGHNFYTKDHDNRHKCAVTYHGGWWYYNCDVVNLNGDYAEPGTFSHYSSNAGVIYFPFKHKLSLKRTQMMFRRM